MVQWSLRKAGGGQQSSSDISHRSLLSSLSDEVHRLCLCFSRELHVCFCACMCTVVVFWVSDLLGGKAAAAALSVP